MEQAVAAAICIMAAFYRKTGVEHVEKVIVSIQVQFCLVNFLAVARAGFYRENVELYRLIIFVFGVVRTAAKLPVKFLEVTIFYPAASPIMEIPVFIRTVKLVLDTANGMGYVVAILDLDIDLIHRAVSSGETVQVAFFV